MFYYTWASVEPILQTVELYLKKKIILQIFLVLLKSVWVVFEVTFTTPKCVLVALMGMNVDKTKRR